MTRMRGEIRFLSGVGVDFFGKLGSCWRQDVEGAVIAEIRDRS